MKKQSKNPIKAKLKVMLQEADCDDIRKDVIKEILSYKYRTDQEIIECIADISVSGCISGAVPKLFDNDNNVIEFFNKHYIEIEKLRSCYPNLVFIHDLRSSLVWFAYEETTEQLAKELGLDITKIFGIYRSAYLKLVRFN